MEIADAEQGAEYRRLAERSIADHGGEYLVRAAEPVVADGHWPPERRLVIVRCPDMATLRRWYDSPEYAPARRLAETALRRRLVFADGVT